MMLDKEALFDSTDEKWLMLEIHAWIETLSLFRAPIPGHKNYPDDVQRLLADAEQYLRRISLAQVFDERIVSRLRQYVGGWPMFSFIEHGAVIGSSGPLYALPQFMRRSCG